MKIAFCSSEVVPFVKTGGLADVCGALPLFLEKLGHELFIFLPRYSGVENKGYVLRKINDDVSSTVIGKNSKVFFIENDQFFKREGLYGGPQGDYADNLERFQLYCRQTLELFKNLQLKMDIVHCHDWQTALLPTYLKFRFQNDPFYRRMRSVFTIHNMAYQGVFPKEKFSKLGLPQNLFDPQGLEFYGQINLLKAGILYSDMATTVSPRYAQEIQTTEFGCGLDGVLRSRKEKVVGILNGLDYGIWDPQKDPWIDPPFSAQNGQGKLENKRRLQKEFKLPQREDVPLFSFVGRLSQQKGIELIADAMKTLVEMDLQIAILGTGEEKYHRRLQDFAQRYPQKFGVHLTFNDPLAHRVYAGSDLFLMPSVFEPCGLSQMISLRYGTIPIVYKTGGLADTITPFDQDGNGFIFTSYTPTAFLNTLKQAMDVYRDNVRFKKLMGKAFAANFSWEESAKKYLQLYQYALSVKV